MGDIVSTANQPTLVGGLVAVQGLTKEKILSWRCMMLSCCWPTTAKAGCDTRKEHGHARVATRSFAKVAFLGLVGLGAAMGTLVAAPVPVRFVEGSLHGFVALRSIDGALVAEGDLLQVVRGGHAEKRMVFRFKDGSVLEESVVFTQQGVYTLQSYGLLQRGPVFAEDIEISMERATGKYRVKTKTHKDGREAVFEGKLELPPDVYNGLILSVLKDLPKGASETIHFVAFMPEPRLIQLVVSPVGEQKVLVGDLAKTAIHYVLKPEPGIWLKLFATLLGRMPPDEHVWILMDDVPAFVRFEGPLYPTGPVWRIQLTSPRWPE